MENRDKRIDPIGIELAIAIFSTSLTTIAFIHQFRPYFRRKPLSKKIRKIRREIIKLQNSVDDFVLILERLSHQDPEIQLSDRNSTISDTLFRLKEKDYVRWLVIHDSIKQVDRNIYDMISEVRDLMELEDISGISESKLTNQADRILMSLGETTFDRLVLDIRSLVKQLRREIELVSHDRK